MRSGRRGWILGGGLAALDEQVSDPHSGSYGQFLTPAQVAARIAYVEKGSRYGGGDVESAIDVEAVHATAPGATIAR